MAAIVSRTLSVHKEHEFLLKLEIAGLNDALAQRVVDSRGNNLAAKVVRFIQNGGFEPTTSQNRARAIMGQNFFGVEEVIRYFGVNPSKQQLSLLSEIPFSEETLKSCKDSHILMAIFPFSILDIRGQVVASDPPLFYHHDWYNKEAFAQEKGEAVWQLILKTPVSSSTSKTWDEQQKLLSENETVPTA